MNGMNLVKVPLTKSHYVDENGEIYKIQSAYYDSSVKKYVFHEDNQRYKCSIKKAKKIYNSAMHVYNNNYVLRHELKALGWTNKEIVKFIQKSKKWRAGEGYVIEQDIVDNRLVLVVRTDGEFCEWLERVNI